MKKNLKFLTVILLFLFTFFSFGFSNNNMKNETLKYESQSKGMVLIEAESKRVFLEKDKDKKLPMASTTKIMTALTILKHIKNLDEEFKVDNRAIGIEGTSIYLRKGEILCVKDLLYGMLLNSGNDAACALAYRLCKDMDCFANIMNEDAKSIGALNSNFKNAHGLDEEGHFTTAYDLAIITAEAMKYPLFCEIVKNVTYKIKGAGGDQGDIRVLRNKNRLLNCYEGCTGVKIGFTDNAGRCLVASAEKNNMKLISVVLNCGPMFEECANLLDLGFKFFENIELLPPYFYERKIEVENGREKEVKIFTKKGFFYPLLKEEQINITYEYDLPQILKAPIKKEQIVGKIAIKLNDIILFEEDIYTTDEVRSSDFLEDLKDIVEEW